EGTSPYTRPVGGADAPAPYAAPDAARPANPYAVPTGTRAATDAVAPDAARPANPYAKPADPYTRTSPANPYASAGNAAPEGEQPNPTPRRTSRLSRYQNHDDQPDA
ncbi:MAG: hypothetical protein GX418_00735, partial [Clostridiales bacterium]|nr:hypothetical protein [Clostridiales bacterium]